jgi:hypothetical protein
MEPTIDQEQAFSETYKKSLDELLSQGWPKRKASRYLDSIAKRNFRKFIKKTKKEGRQGSVMTDDLNIIDNSDIDMV